MSLIILSTSFCSFKEYSWKPTKLSSWFEALYTYKSSSKLFFFSALLIFFITSTNFLNGKDVPANELPNARKLCEDTAKEKSDKDGKLLPAAKEQASVVLESFYEQWIKAFDKSYTVEIK